VRPGQAARTQLFAAAAAAAAWLVAAAALMGRRLRCRYVVLPKDFEKGYKSNVKKSSDEFAFYK
jgi:26S proteasome regulatory subunit T3